MELDEFDRNIVLPVLQNYKYFAYPENILLAAVVETNKGIRQAACNKIIECCSNRMLDDIRYFDKGKIVINCSAKLTGLNVILLNL